MRDDDHGAPIELWVGPEATVSRIGDAYFDQIEATGFARRLTDIDRIATLGAKRVRFPILWERVSPRPRRFQWRWVDARLARLQRLGVAPIAGLLHHGSGPRHTSLLDPAFAPKLADYARAVAERYPWIDAWTPVNEPVTTARFAGLYGHWYPHRRDDASFVRAVLNQIRGVMLAMRAVREINPGAQLVQTDDIGFVDSTLRLRYQAAFENSRRWLSFDLLTGRVGPDHPLWTYLLWAGASEAELMEFVEAPLPPDVIGMNVYVTSERFLDDRLHLYPEHMHGGNGRDAYVDTEAVRVLGRGIGGFAARIREAHARFALPIALTEVHLGCSREEQLRWLDEAWRAAAQAKRDGVDMRAVTLWAAFGSCDWDSLMTQPSGRYEAGLWDVRGPRPRATALVHLAREFASGADGSHPVLASPGWWHRRERLVHPAHGPVRDAPVTGQPVLITGATGTLGQAFARICEARGIAHRLTTRGELDIARSSSVRAALQRWKPWAVINAAGYVRVDDAETDLRQWRENALGPAVLAGACAREGVRCLAFSSDLVFDGTKGAAYLESDEPNPLNAYGRAKRVAELELLQHGEHTLIVRTAAFFGPWDRYNFVTQGMAAVRRGERWRAPAEEFVSPTYVPDLVHAALDLLIDGESAIWHLAGGSAVSWADFALMCATAAGFDAEVVEPIPAAALHQPATRPRFAALGSERASPMPPLERAIARYMQDVSNMPAATDLDATAGGN